MLWALSSFAFQEKKVLMKLRFDFLHFINLKHFPVHFPPINCLIIITSTPLSIPSQLMHPRKDSPLVEYLKSRQTDQRPLYSKRIEEIYSPYGKNKDNDGVVAPSALIFELPGNFPLKSWQGSTEMMCRVLVSFARIFGGRKPMVFARKSKANKQWKLWNIQSD